MLKSQEDRSQLRYIARWVVKDFGQKKDVDFEEIFLSIIKLMSIRFVLGLTSCLEIEME